MMMMMALLAAFAVAQPQTYVPPKLVHEGSTSKPIAGAGKVVVQVEVKADGSHRAMRVVRSSNHGDDAAAMEIAQSSTYSLGKRDNKPVTVLYDFTLRFSSSSTAGGGASAQSMGGARGSIDSLIRAGKYDEAQSRAQTALQSNPNDRTLNAELGTAQFFLNDADAAAESFKKAGAIPKEFAQVAAQAFQLAAANLASTNAASALDYGQRAVELAPTGSSYFALGQAELDAGNASSAVQDLLKAKRIAFADPKSDLKSRVSIDSELMQAYLKAGDTSDAATTAREIQRLDPSSDVAQIMLYNQYMNKANAEAKAGSHDAAVGDYLRAAQSAPSKTAVTAYAAAALEESRTAKPDYDAMKADAQKGLAIDPGDPLSLYAEGVAEYGEYVTGGSMDSTLKQEALTALDKAKDAAQAAGNTALAGNIATFMQQNVKGP